MGTFPFTRARRFLIYQKFYRHSTVRSSDFQHDLYFDSQTCLPRLAAVVPDFALSPSQETPRTTISTLLNVTASSSPLPLLPSPPPLQRPYHSTVPPPRPLTVAQRTAWDPPPSCIMLGLGPLRSRDDGIQCICFEFEQISIIPYPKQITL